MSPSTTTRWCPTPEQLMILEELYRRGLRTPSAPQIQRITAHLSFYGKIQGKNVFYWFQNHKARDRQKLRKKLAKQLHQEQQQLLHHNLYQYQLDPQTHFTHPLDFQAPSAFHSLSSCFSTDNLNPQGTGVCEEVPEEVMRQTWRADLAKDCLIGSYAHDSMMIMDAGPTFPCCRSKPLETLELFPLISPTEKNDQETPSNWTLEPSTSYLDGPLSK